MGIPEQVAQLVLGRRSNLEPGDPLNVEIHARLFGWVQFVSSAAKPLANGKTFPELHAWCRDPEQPSATRGAFVGDEPDYAHDPAASALVVEELNRQGYYVTRSTGPVGTLPRASIQRFYLDRPHAVETFEAAGETIEQALALATVSMLRRDRGGTSPI